MNTNPNATVVLCYGDSNTWGQKSDRSGRFPANVRWTGVMQDRLGPDYYIIEEGLGGRTTDLEHYDPAKPSRNGLVYFKACLNSHAPLDVVVIMLGTNDFKTKYHRSAQDVAGVLRQYVDFTRHFFDSGPFTQPRIVLVSPATMDETAPAFESSMPEPGLYDVASAEKSHELAAYIEKLAQETGCDFFDAATITTTGEDGCHIDTESHTKLGKALAAIIRK